MGKHTDSFSYLRATAEPPMGRQTRVQSLTCRERKRQSESSCLARLGRAVSPAWGRQHTKETCTAAKVQPQKTPVRPKPLAARTPGFPASSNMDMRTDTAAHRGGGGSNMSFLAFSEAPTSLFRLHLQEPTSGTCKRNAEKETLAGALLVCALLVRTFIIM